MKYIVIYAFLLAVIDSLINLIINFILGNPGEVILTELILRIIIIMVVFPLNGLLLNLLIRENLKRLIILNSVIIYAIIPVIIYFLKANNESIWQVFLDINFTPILFIDILLPYLIACFITYFILIKILHIK